MRPLSGRRSRLSSCVSTATSSWKRVITARARPSSWPARIIGKNNCAIWVLSQEAQASPRMKLKIERFTIRTVTPSSASASGAVRPSTRLRDGNPQGRFFGSVRGLSTTPWRISSRTRPASRPRGYVLRHGLRQEYGEFGVRVAMILQCTSTKGKRTSRPVRSRHGPDRQPPELCANLDRRVQGIAGRWGWQVGFIQNAVVTLPLVALAAPLGISTSS
jgi:hypothetical protein